MDDFEKKNLVFFDFAYYLSFWASNKVEEEYTTMADKTKNQIYHENYLLCSHIISMIESDENRSFFVNIIEWKLGEQIHGDCTFYS